MVPWYHFRADLIWPYKYGSETAVKTHPGILDVKYLGWALDFPLYTVYSFWKDAGPCQSTATKMHFRRYTTCFLTPKQNAFPEQNELLMCKEKQRRKNRVKSSAEKKRDGKGLKTEQEPAWNFFFVNNNDDSVNMV
jgi:hypothetical protein